MSAAAGSNSIAAGTIQPAPVMYSNLNQEGGGDRVGDVVAAATAGMPNVAPVTTTTTAAVAAAASSECILYCSRTIRLVACRTTVSNTT